MWATAAGSWLRLLALPEDQSNFYTEIYQRELNDADDPTAMMAAGNRMGKPGVLMFRGWGLQTRLGAEGILQLTGTIGYYSMLAMTVNACELPAGDGAEVLRV